jgi:hypothetical protein
MLGGQKESGMQATPSAKKKGDARIQMQPRKAQMKGIQRI